MNEGSIPKSWEGENPRGEVANVLSCDMAVSEFQLYSRHYVHIRIKTLEKGINPFITRAILQPNGTHCHTRRSLSETSRQIHIPRK